MTKKQKEELTLNLIRQRNIYARGNEPIKLKIVDRFISSGLALDGGDVTITFRGYTLKEVLIPLGEVLDELHLQNYSVKINSRTLLQILVIVIC